MRGFARDCLTFCQNNVKRHRFNAGIVRILFDLFTIQYSNDLIAGKLSTSRTQYSGKM